MGHQSARNTRGRLTVIVIAAIMTATTCLAGWTITDNCSYAYAAETEAPTKNTAEAPAKITGLKLEVTSHPAATLTWDKSDCDGYKVYRGSKAIARVKAGDADDLVTYTDEELEPGASCTYLVRPYKIVNGEEVYGAYSSAMKIVEGYTYEAADVASGTPAGETSGASADADAAATGAAAGSIKLTGYTGRAKRLVIPSELDGRKVTGIGDGCFSGNVWLERVSVPEGIVKIGDYAFECCGLLERAYLPESLISIGNGAFSGCGKLILADISDSTASIGDGAFMACGKLEHINLPKHLSTLGKFAFALCAKLKSVTFRGSEIGTIPERAFNGCAELKALTLPGSVKTIEKRAFFGCSEFSKLELDDDYYDEDGDSYDGPVTEIGDYAFEGTKIDNIIDYIDSNASIGFSVFGRNEIDEYNTYDYDEEKREISLPASVTLTEGAFYGALISGIRLENSENANYKLIDGSLYSNDGKTLFVYFPTEMDEQGNFVPTEEARQKVFHVPEGVTRIAAYAFFECGLEQIFLPSTVTEVSDHAFTRSGIAPDLGMLTDYDGNGITAETEGLSFGGQAFDNWSLEPVYGLAGSSGDGSEGENSGPKFPENMTMTSLAGDKSIYRAEDFDGFADIYENFADWCRAYIEYNKPSLPMIEDGYLAGMTYCEIYKGNDHYNQMASALNGDAGKVRKSLPISGYEYEEMYLMMDHGLFRELRMAKIQNGDLILYSGITDAFVERIAGVGAGELNMPDDLIGAIGSEYREKAMMSTAANFNVSHNFMANYGVMLFILASRDALNALGTYGIDCYRAAQTGYGGEHEILFNSGARFKVLDVGTAVLSMDDEDDREAIYITMELLNKKDDTSEPLDEELGKTGRGDLFNLANNVKVTWKEVPGAKYYKVYREGVTDPSETMSEPVIVTSGLVGWDKQPGLTSGHAYKYKIVASLTGAGDPGGDSPLSYSKLMYRLKTVAIRSVKNTAPGKVMVKYDKTSDGDSYVLQYSEHEDMSGAKTKVVQGAENTSCVIGGLKKGKTYYVSIRVRKKVDGISYYTTFGVPKKIVITQ